MVAKKRVSRKEEASINTKIATGAILTLFFLVLFFATWNAFQEDTTVQERPFDELTPQEQVAKVQESEQNLQDKINYQRALTFADGNYCTFISDEALKIQCESETPEPIPIEEVPERPPEQIANDINFQRALTFNDTSYCEAISDEELRDACKSEVQG